MRFFHLALLLFCIIFFNIPSSAEINKKIKNDSLQQQQTDSAKVIEIAFHKQEIDLLKQQNKLLTDGQGNLISVVLWSLTGTVTLGVLLIGYGWWSNFRLNEADKQQIKEETGRMLSDSESKVEISFERFRASLLATTEERIEKKIVDLVQKSGEIEESVAVLDTMIKNLRKEFLENVATLRSVEELIWEIKGIPINKVLTQIQGGFAALAAGNPTLTKSILDKIAISLNEDFLLKNRELELGGRDIILKNLVRFEDGFAVQAATIRDILSKLKIKDDK